MLKRVALTLALVVSPCLASKKPPLLPVADQSVHTNFGDFLFTAMAETGPLTSRRLAGTIVNNTTKSWYHPAFDFHFQSFSGAPLACAECEIVIQGPFAPGQRIDFGRDPTAEPFGILVSTELGPNHSLASITLGSLSFYSADYVFSLSDPAGGRSLKFEDANFSFAFLPGYKGIQITIRNKATQEATLDWNGASMIGVTGGAIPIAHGRLKITDPTADKPPSTIAASSTFEDTVTPIASLRFDNQAWGPGNWLPYAPVANSYRGQTFGLVLPISLSGNAKKYVFRFHIDDVR
jgi:hypothetical protein